MSYVPASICVRFGPEQFAALSEIVKESLCPTCAQSCGLAAWLDDGSTKTSATASAARRIIDSCTRGCGELVCSGEVPLEPVRAQLERTQLVRATREAVPFVLEDIVFDLAAKSAQPLDHLVGLRLDDAR